MNKIVSKEHFSANVVKLEVEAPLIARSRKAGHFVIVKVGKTGERIPLTIAAADTEKGTITLVIQTVGESSRKLCELNEGDYITDLVGPLGQATHIEKVGTVVCAGGGVGCAPLLPIVEAMHKAGNRVIVVLAARSKDLVILEEQMKANSDEVIVMTDDGSYGKKGLVTNGSQHAPLPKWAAVREADLPQPPLVLIGKAVKPSENEVQMNPRARSAVLRVAERTEGKFEG